MTRLCPVSPRTAGAIEGARTPLIGKSGQVVGTSAISSSTVWNPGNPSLRRPGVTGDASAAREDLDALVADRAERSPREVLPLRFIGDERLERLGDLA